MIIRIALSLILFFTVYAEASEVYVIKNIKISSSNKSANIARNDAIEAGQIKAFRGLVKLHYPDAQSKAAKVNKEDIFSLVESYELSEEKRSATNYYAKLKVKFSRSHVDKLMQSLGASFSESAVPTKNTEAAVDIEEPKPIVAASSETVAPSAPLLTTLVVPVFIKDGKEYWFDDDNLWLNIWQKHKQSSNFVLPLADLEDITLINKGIINKNLIDLAPLLEKYNVNNIAIYSFEDLEDGQNHRATLKVNYINKHHYSWQTYHFKNALGNDLSKLLTEEYDEAQVFKFDSNLDTCCKVVNDLVTVEPRVITIDFPVEKISEWLNLQQILKTIPYVSDVRLEKMSITNYRFFLTINISTADFIDILNKYGFRLGEQNNNLFLLTKNIEPQEIEFKGNADEEY